MSCGVDIQCHPNVNVEFKVTLHEQARCRGTLQYYKLQSVTQLDTMVKSTMTETCSAVLRSQRNCSSDGAERTYNGRAFHARAAVTGKAQSPSVVRRVDGMTSVICRKSQPCRPRQSRKRAAPRPPPCCTQRWTHRMTNWRRLSIQTHICIYAKKLFEKTNGANRRM